MVDSSISDRQLLTECHVKIVAKNYKIGSGLKTTLLFIKFTRSNALPSQFFLLQLLCGGVSDERKMVDSSVNDRQLFIICHVKVVAKSCKMVCGLRTTLFFYEVHSLQYFSLTIFFATTVM